MSNLSELLPAGAGAKSADFVASGTIGSGVTVAVNSNGTVSAISGTDISAGAATVFEAGPAVHIAAVFDSNSNKVVVAYHDAFNFDYGTAVVGTVSGTSISFGTPVVFHSATTDYIAATFDVDSAKVAIAYVDISDNQYGKAIVGTVSGTSISFGSEVEFHNVATDTLAITYDSNSDKVVIVYEVSTAAGGGEAIVGTVSGTSISFGTAVVFTSNEVTLDNKGTVFDSNSNKVVITYEDKDEADAPKAIVGTVSGTSISFGTPAYIEKTQANWPSACFDSNSNKIVALYSVTGASSDTQFGKVAVGTVSGTSISFGEPTAFVLDTIDQDSIVFDSNSNKVIISLETPINGNVLDIFEGEVFGDSVVFSSKTFIDKDTAYSQLVFDSNSNKVVVCYYDVDNSGAGTSNVITTGSTNSGRFIGISDQAIADTATGKVIMQGGVSSKVSGLTTRKNYYVQADGSLSTTESLVPAGRALSTTSILLEG